MKRNPKKKRDMSRFVHYLFVQRQTIPWTQPTGHTDAIAQVHAFGLKVPKVSSVFPMQSMISVFSVHSSRSRMGVIAPTVEQVVLSFARSVSVCLRRDMTPAVPLRTAEERLALRTTTLCHECVDAQQLSRASKKKKKKTPSLVCIYW